MDFNDFIGSLAWRLRQGLGLKPSDQRQLEAWRTKYAQDKADNQDRLEAIKEEVRQLEARILQKKGKFDQARGTVQEIIGIEIGQAFEDLDGKKTGARIVADKIKAISVALNKIQELDYAMAHHLSEHDLDKLALMTEDNNATTEETFHALKELNALEHARLEAKPAGLQERLSQLSSPPEQQGAISPETLERLRQLQQQAEA